MLIDLQLSPGTMAWSAILEGSQAAEEAGFSALWAFDHLDGSLLRGHTMLECWSLMGAVAASTRTIGVGTLVANIASRPPGVLAAAAASVQAISGGRLRLGLGAGTSPRSPFASEQRAMNMPVKDRLAERHTALVDVLDLLDTLWSPDRDPVYAGFARPEVRPPVLVGVNSAALATIAGQRCDGVNVRRSDPDRAEWLRAARAAHAARPTGRSGGVDAPFEATMWTLWNPDLLDADHPDRRAWAALGIDRLILTALEPLAAATIAAASRYLR